MKLLGSSLFRPAFAEKAVFALILLRIFWVLNLLFMRFLHWDPGTWYYPIQSVMSAAIWIYIWLSFRQLLYAIAPRPLIDLFLYMLIAVHLFSYFLHGVLATHAPLVLSASVWILSSVVLIAFAVWLQGFPHALFGFKRWYTGTLILTQAMELLLYQVLARLIGDRLYVFWEIGNLLVAGLGIVNLILLFQIFQHASKNPLTGEVNSASNLIDEIGRSEHNPGE